MVTQNAPILFVDHATGMGGAEHSLLLLMQHLDPIQWQSHLACPDGELARQARELGITWHSISLPQLRRSWQFAQDWRHFSHELARTAKTMGATAVYANTVRAALYSMGAARVAKRPFIWHMRDFWLSETAPRFGVADWAGKWLLCRSAAQLIANSAATASHLPCGEKTAVVHNGIDLTRFTQAPDDREFRQAFGIPADAPLVGMVGRLRPWKGQHRFIEMVALVRQAQPEAHFVIVGGAPLGEPDDYSAQLRQQAAAHNLNGHLHFTGHLSDVRPALAALDVFVHPGDPEPFGLVNIEAMASGKPVVAFAHGALPEIVADGQTGLLVLPENIAALANAVSQLLTDPTARQRLGQAGQCRAMEQFSIDETAVRIAQILQKTVGGA
ncbi:MAG: glycosyltransferase family 4 protein [Ardenticatenaceae bacterium]|nr:glycosyltransferase family 4 protein [Ardenticatenaceae bacterium]